MASDITIDGKVMNEITLHVKISRVTLFRLKLAIFFLKVAVITGGFGGLEVMTEEEEWPQ